MKRVITPILFLIFLVSFGAIGKDHPSLILTSSDVKLMQEGYGKSPLFRTNVDRVQRELDAEMQRPLAVPVPKDAGGGYTHEQHKKNGRLIMNAGVLYQVSGKQKYADFAANLFLKYAALYPSLGEHPKKKNQAPGRLFWQSLNESVWLVMAIQGYDAIYKALDHRTRQNIELNVLRPMADFLSVGQPKTFDKIHNHGTWAAAAVGMTGYVIGEDDYVEKALLGLDKSGKSGFLKQLSLLFSPEGYYAEGPYYQRYALMPFVLFAQAIETNQPERKIFEYRNSIVMKAIYTTVQLSYNDLFFPINDAIKSKGLDTMELVSGLAIAYGMSGDNQLLDISARQKRVALTGGGAKIALARDAGKIVPFQFKTMKLSDGAEGDEGALVILRSSDKPGHQALVLKNTSQGMGHGHFDKLSWIFYDNGQEIITDYGAARFLNVEAKNGGRYLPENKSWAKQTIAHNTLVVDETSHFHGKWKDGQKKSPEQLAFDETETIQLSSAVMRGAYEGVAMTRTIALIKDPELEFPVTLDVLKVDATQPHLYDLPVHYNGQLMDQSVVLKSATSGMRALGDKNGYEHLWLKAVGTPKEGKLARFTWLTDNRFYTLNTVSEEQSQFLFTELGAHDPNFNLRREQAIIHRIPKGEKTIFVSLLEPHGDYNPAVEYTLGSHSQIKSLKLHKRGSYQAITFTTVFGKRWILTLSYDQDKQKTHQIKLGDKEISWQGFYSLQTVE
ncbi:alginate lyase family protein [Temperatibacter marinus]|uniref:Alginate lyase family protein n=1 Tax=Temperatibacter marinus TaxID=1456591 RepID=A0AA52HBP8_9PROT|nr:alginate lyase family protein [Temperatibacter marinus]WND03863.1 alginate lyase family protein [Temperatibacter marinus]